MKQCGTARMFFKQSVNPVRNTFNSFTVFMHALNVKKVYQVRVISENFAFSQTRRYTNFHGTNKGKMGLPCFEQTRILNGMKMPWYSLCSFVFFVQNLEPTVKKDTWMRTTSGTAMMIVWCGEVVCHSGGNLITAIFRVPYQQLQGKLITAFSKTSYS